MRRRTRIAGGMLATVALAGGVTIAGRSSASSGTTDGDPTVAEASVVRTSAVTRNTLTDEERYDGTIKFAESRRLSDAGGGVSTGSGTGSSGTESTGSVLTAVAEAGDELRRGDVAFEVDTIPNVVLYGDTPMYRDLSTDAEPGVDVMALEQNLALLGYDADGEMTVDETFDDATAAAVERWETDLGIESDGIVRRGDVTFLPGPAEVSSVNVGVGSSVGSAAVLDVAIVATDSQVLVAGVTTDDDARVSNVTQSDTITPGEILYDLDDVGVIALIGDQPLARTLSEGDQGPDVRLLQENLLAMGYSGEQSVDDGDEDEQTELEVNGTFDSATRAAVEEMQFDAGQEVDGVVEIGDAVVIPADLAVVERLDTVTDTEVEVSPHDVILSLTHSRRIVEVELPMEDQDQLLIGTEVRVAIPGEGDVRGVVASVGNRAAVSAAGETAADSSTVTITIEVLDVVELRQLEAPVDVYVEETLADSVLVVPVSALVALVDGGFAVQVVDDTAAGGLRYVAVEPGAFANNQVEVTGDGIDENTQVVIA